MFPFVRSLRAGCYPPKTKKVDGSWRAMQVAGVKLQVVGNVRYFFVRFTPHFWGDDPIWLAHVFTTKWKPSIQFDFYRIIVSFPYVKKLNMLPPKIPMQTMQSFKCQWNIYSLFIRFLSINFNYCRLLCCMACRSNDSTFAIFWERFFGKNYLYTSGFIRHREKAGGTCTADEIFWLAGLAWKPKNNDAGRMP